MTPTSLAFAYARRRSLSTLLVVLLLATGTAIVTLTLVVTRELETRMTRDAQGIDLVVGAKGSPLQIVLAGVYHVDVPPGNISLDSVAKLRAHRMIASAIPLALGDSFRGYRIVGTEAALIEHYGGRIERGDLWTKPMQAVLGSEVARRTALDVGARFEGSHGLSDQGGAHAGEAYSVVGVLAPTGTVVDRMVLTPIESVWHVHDVHQAKPADADHAEKHDDDHEAADREVTLVLVRYRTPVAAASLPREINETTDLVAASPAQETARLLSAFGVGVDVLRGFAYLLVAASALMLFVALAQALDERRYDLAILRALGAHRSQVAWVLLAESLGLAIVGAALGIAAAHVVVSSIGTVLPAAAPLAGAAWRFAPEEALVMAVAVAAGILASLWPAWQAYRLDVAATLAES